MMFGIRRNAGWNNYVEQVLTYLKTDRANKDRIKADLLDSLESRRMSGDERGPHEMLGAPKEVASNLAMRYGAEFVDYSVNEHSVFTGANVEVRRYRFDYSIGEYRSSITIGGLPLVHIIKGKNHTVVAKGIIAIGPVAIGLVAIGGMSVGLLAVGGLSLALLVALGGLAVSGLFSLGGLSISYFLAAGGAAIAYRLALGGFAMAHDVAIGTQAIAMVAGYTAKQGEFLMDNNLFSVPLPQYARKFGEVVDYVFPNYHPFLRGVIDFLMKLMWMFPGSW